MEFDADRKFVAANFADGRFYLAGEGNNKKLVAEYQHKDHLGNVRVAFTDRNGDKRVQLLDGAAGPSEVTQINDYFPFGLQFPKACGAVVVPENRYKYNGKEWEEEFGLYDYGARYYDPAIGRWGAVDPLASDYAPFSPYNYVLNNPINSIDPDGMRVVVKSEEDQEYLMNQITDILGAEAASVFSFNKGGVLKVSKKGLKSLNSNDEIDSDVKELANGLNELAQDDAVIEFRTVADENESTSYNPVIGSTEDGDPINAFSGGAGVILKSVKAGGVSVDLGADKQGLSVINRKQAAIETYETTDGGTTKACASCVTIHELVDHQLGYIRSGYKSRGRSADGVQNQNRALKLKGSKGRDPSKHKD